MERPSVVAGGGRRGQRHALGCAMVLVATALFGINGSVAKVALSSGLSSLCLGVLLSRCGRGPSSTSWCTGGCGSHSASHWPDLRRWSSSGEARRSTASASRVGIAAMLEPVVATIVARLWLRETLSLVQLVGAGFSSGLSSSPRRPGERSPKRGTDGVRARCQTRRVLRRNHICLLVAAGFLVVSAVPAALAGRQIQRVGTQASLLQAVNAARASHGLRPLQLDTTLERAAQAHTLDMLRGNYFGHGDFSSRMAAFHLHGTLGENLAWGSGAYGRAQAIVNLWLGSPGHRANLLRPSFHRIGLGLANGAFQGARAATVVTADFGG